jgi:hypothetical protein
MERNLANKVAHKELFVGSSWSSRENREPGEDLWESAVLNPDKPNHRIYEINLSDKACCGETNWLVILPGMAPK